MCIRDSFHAENGRKLWAVQPGRSDEPAMTATSNSDIVIVTAGPVVYGYNKFTGEQVIEHRLIKQPTAGPVMTDTQLFIPVEGGGIYAYALGVLQYIHQFGALPAGSPRSFIWRFICNEKIIIPAVVGDQGLAFASQAGNLHSVATRGRIRGTTIFQVQMAAPASAPLSIAPNSTSSTVFVLTGAHQVLAVDLIKGRVLWEFPVGRPMLSAPIVIGDDVYVVTNDGSLLRITRDLSTPNWGRPLEMPLQTAPNGVGMGLEEIELTAEQQDLGLDSSIGLKVLSVGGRSIGNLAGFQPNDIWVRIRDTSIESIDTMKEVITNLPNALSHPVTIIRNGQLQRLNVQRTVDRWEVRGIRDISAVGRFSVYGIDQSNRLAAISKSSAQLVGRIPITGFDFHHRNEVTDQIYLVSKTGRVACLREIGPSVRMPDASPESSVATVKDVLVRFGEGLAEDTVIMNVELADGSELPITAGAKGTVHRIVARPGARVEVGDLLLHISDDQFATYYRNPEDRPIDVKIGQ